LCETDDKIKAKPHSERGMLGALAERFTDKHINSNPGKVRSKNKKKSVTKSVLIYFIL